MLTKRKSLDEKIRALKGILAGQRAIETILPPKKQEHKATWFNFDERVCESLEKLSWWDNEKVDFRSGKI